jgi:serralysin
MKKKFQLFMLPILLLGMPEFGFAQLDKLNKKITDNPQDITIKPSTIKGTPIGASVIYDFSNVKICVDKISENNPLPQRDFTAVAPLPVINSDGSIGKSVGVIRQPLAGETNKMWNPGQTIKVFIAANNTSELIRSKVRFYATEWTKYANIKFEFVNDFSDAQIKVGFENNRKSWSWIGKDVLFNPLRLYTVNFGWFDILTPEEEFKRTIQHEFGHVLGFIHEHQSPAGNIPWDKEKVYNFFAGSPNKWSRTEVDINLFAKYSKTSTNFSAYDRYSIMHYSYPPELTTDGSSAPKNFNFSSTDKQYAGLFYPFPPTPSNGNGILRTNDDCDAIAFKVEYNAVPADKVEFNLALGEENSKKVTWWKQVGIPMTNNTEALLWVQNHSLIQSENKTMAQVQIPFAEINTNKSISFWKAKFLGVHTLLNYNWNVFPAIIGGCRITLLWNKDSCN